MGCGPVRYDRNSSAKTAHWPASAPTGYGQALDAQLEQLRAAGSTRIYREKVTGAHNDRLELLRMLDRLAAGDVVTVTRIERLARTPSTCSPSSEHAISY
jgi:DNA invertase Pin-like site-specific DNA recombinase